MTADLYQRPSREAIAAKVNGTLPGAPKAAPPHDPLACFSRHLQARMRALGWDQVTLQERAGIKTPQVAARAVNGTGCDLGLAGRIAALIGLDLAAMLGPYQCGTCHGDPPSGYTCLECGASKRQSTPSERLAAAAAEAGRRPA